MKRTYDEVNKNEEERGFPLPYGDHIKNSIGGTNKLENEKLDSFQFLTNTEPDKQNHPHPSLSDSDKQNLMSSSNILGKQKEKDSGEKSSVEVLNPKSFTSAKTANSPHLIYDSMKQQTFPSDTAYLSDFQTPQTDATPVDPNFKSSSDQKIQLPSLKKMKLHPPPIIAFDRNEYDLVAQTPDSKEKKFYSESELGAFPYSDSLDNSQSEEKSPKKLSYQAMITNAILSKEKKSATNKEIIAYMEENYMDILEKKQGDWQKTCRSVLSVHFMRVNRPGSKSEWQMKPPQDKKKKPKKIEKEREQLQQMQQLQQFLQFQQFQQMQQQQQQMQQSQSNSNNNN